MEQNSGAQPEQASEHEGMHYLKLLGLEAIADEPITGKDLTMKDFLVVCGDHARPALKGLEAIGPQDPRFEPMREALRGFIYQYVQKEPAVE